MAEVVVASVGHIPSTKANVGFSLKMPFNNVLVEVLLMAS
jgi:hypothetical protein